MLRRNLALSVCKPRRLYDHAQGKCEFARTVGVYSLITQGHKRHCYVIVRSATVTFV